MPFDELGVEICKRVKKLVLTGLTREKLYQAVTNAPGYNGQPEIFVVEDFEQAVKKAAAVAEPGDTVILSPACTSFDRFKNFEERGELFRAVVNAL